MGLKPRAAAPPRLEHYDAVLAAAGIERKGKSMPYSAENGHMFSFLDRDGHMGLRLPSAEREAFLARFDTRLSVQYGAIMKEYVVVPDPLLADPSTLAPFLQRSRDHVRTLKPKTGTVLPK